MLGLMVGSGDDWRRLKLTNDAHACAPRFFGGGTPQRFDGYDIGPRRETALAEVRPQRVKPTCTRQSLALSPSEQSFSRHFLRRREEGTEGGARAR